MPQRCPGKRRASVASSLRVVTFHALLVAALAGCSVAELEKLATEKDPQKSTRSTRGTGLSQKVGTELLSSESVITGGHQSLTGYLGQFSRMTIGEGDEIQFIEPTAVGGIEGLLYIVDADPKIIYRYDLVLNEVVPIPDIATHLKGKPGNIFVAKDRSFYIVDSIGQQVLHFDEMGQLLTRFQDLANLSRPVDVTVIEETGDVLVADGSFSHILVFNSMGKAVRTVGRRGTGTGRFRAITAMTQGDDGLFVVDRLELPVQVLTRDGEYRYSFGESDLVYPTSIAVDQEQRVFVGDRSDNTIRVYQNGQLLMTYGGGGSAPGRFRIITGLWVSGNLLYVADSLNGRVQVLRINPGAPIVVPPAS